MSTNSLDLSNLTQQALGGGSPELLSGLPDIGELNRLAHQFFSEIAKRRQA